MKRLKEYPGLIEIEERDKRVRENVGYFLNSLYSMVGNVVGTLSIKADTTEPQATEIIKNKRKKFFKNL